MKTSNNAKNETTALQSQTEGILNMSNPKLPVFTKENLKFTLIGGVELEQVDSRMWVTLMVEKETEGEFEVILHDRVDLQSLRAIEKLSRRLSQLAHKTPRELLKTITGLTSKLQAIRLDNMTRSNSPFKKHLTEEAEQKAVEFLSKPDLLKRLIESFEAIGLHATPQELQLLYFSFISFKTTNPFNVALTGSSREYLSSIQSSLADLIPGENKVYADSLSGQAMYHITDLNDKLLVISDLDLTAKSLLPIVQLSQNGSVNKLMTKKNSRGELKTIQINTNGKLSVCGVVLNPKTIKLLSGSVLPAQLSQTIEVQQKRMQYQAKLSGGGINPQSLEQTKELLQNTLRVLKPIQVKNPFAEQLMFPVQIINSSVLYSQFLKLIEVITCLHQFQLEHKTDKITGEIYLQPTTRIIKLAYELFKPILRGQADVLTHKQREFIESIREALKTLNSGIITAPQINRHLGRNDRMFTNRMLRELIDLGFIEKVEVGSHNTFGYKLLEEADNTSELETIINQLEKSVMNLKAA